MSKRSNGLTEAKIKKWIKEGRGSGRGADYSPWLRVRDIASKGRSQRVSDINPAESIISFPI